MRWVLQLHIAPGAPDDAVDAALLGLPGAAGRNLPGSVFGGDASWDVTSQDHPAGLLDERVLTCVEAVALTPLYHELVSTPPPVVKRTLLLGVRADAEVVAVERFEAELASMPRHVPTIRSWALSRVDRDRSSGSWTHAWEQEYETVDGLLGEYMVNPYHWAGVDRWFDTEVPGWIVEHDLVHVFYESRSPVLAGEGLESAALPTR